MDQPRDLFASWGRPAPGPNAEEAHGPFCLRVALADPPSFGEASGPRGARLVGWPGLPFTCSAIQCIAAGRAGKHVICETTSRWTLTRHTAGQQQDRCARPAPS